MQRNGKRIRETLDTLAKANARCQEIVDDIKTDRVKLLALKDEKKHLEALKRVEAFPTEEAFAGAKRLLEFFPSGTAQDDVIAARERLLAGRHDKSFVDVGRLVKYMQERNVQSTLSDATKVTVETYLKTSSRFMEKYSHES